MWSFNKIYKVFSRGSLKLIYDATLSIDFGKDGETCSVEVSELDSMDAEEGEVKIKEGGSTKIGAQMNGSKKEVKDLVNRWFEFLRINY